MPNGAVIEGRSTAQRVKHKSWRTAVAEAAREAADELDGPLDGPLELWVDFRFAMPASRPKRVRSAGWAWKISAPDVDKAIRALGDGLEAGGLVANDARFCNVHITKCEVVGWTGAHVEIRRVVAGP